jgi:hypothetical protein
VGVAELLAPAAPVFRRRRTLEALALDPALGLGAGGEARVIAIPADPALVAKLYHHPTIERARKLALMMEDPPRLDASSATLAWPADLLLDGRGRFAGFLMPRAEGPRIFELYNPSTRRKAAPLCDHGLLHRAGANLAAAFHALHGRGYVVGDVNESNVLVGGGGVVTLVDTDSFQVRDPEDGSVHRSGVGKPEFTPPELQGRPFADFDRTPEHDRFGLAVLLFLLLMEGTHPFAGRMRSGGETPPVEERIRRGLFPHHGHDAVLPPRMAPRFSLLHPGLRALFVRAFVDGHTDPAARPAAAEWRDMLDAARERLVECGHNPLHRHGSHLDACPWCERTALLGGRDPFPAHLAPLPRLADDGAGDGSADGTTAIALGGPIPAAAPASASPGVAIGGPGAARAARRADPLTPAVQALGTPLPWILPLLWMVVFSPTDGIQAVSLAGFVWVVIQAFRRGMGPLRPASVCAFLFLVLMVMGVLASLSDGPRYTSNPYGEHDPYEEGAPVPDDLSAIPLTVELGQPHSEETMDLPPRLTNADEVKTILAERYSPWVRDHIDQDRLATSVYVRADGTVDPDSVFVQEVEYRTPSHDPGAVRAARAMRFEPLTYLGERMPVWVGVDVTITR